MAQVAPTAQYITRRFREADAEPVLELLKQSLGESPTLQRIPSLWQWKHQVNPFGPSYVRVACAEEERIVGMRSFMQWQLKSEDNLLRAVRAVDTATHPGYQRLGIFSTLTSQVIDEVQQEGVDLVFNSPNKYVLPGYLKLGWRYVAKIQPLIKVLNYPAFVFGLAQYKLRTTGAKQHPTDTFFRQNPLPAHRFLERTEAVVPLLQQHEQLWAHYRGARTPRSLEYLRWRYGQHPTIPYWVISAEHQGKLQGCAIFRANTRFGLKEVLLVELILAEPNERVCYYLLEQLRATVRSDYLITYFSPGSFNRHMVERWGFRAVPRFGMNLVIRPLHTELPFDPFSIGNWAFSLGDLELF